VSDAEPAHDGQACVFCQAAQGAGLAPDPAGELAARVAGLIMPLLEQIAAQRRRLLTVAEVCEQLHLSRSVVYELMYKGELRSVEIPMGNGKRATRRFEQAEVDAFVARHRTGPVTTPGAFPAWRGIR
jgi:excisionase family DNA binding protein